jgi:signal transduction histidine kinase
VLAAQEDERRRVARELHDDTMQSLAALLMGLEGVLLALPAGQSQTETARLSVQRLRDLATRMLDELRHLALDLRPAVLDDHGLVAAVRWLAATLTERTGLPCRVTVSGDLPPEQRLPPATETALFRITQEALANVAKHAQATQCRVRLERTAGAISVTVEDNGAGLPLAPEFSESPSGAPAGPRQMGLFNMRERAALLGGTCTIRRQGASGGTVVRAELPLLS